jgi:DNA-binding response OmpR family regulator
MLPKRSGFDVLEGLRELKSTHLKRVVIMTASPRHLQSLDRSELTGVLVKPFDIDDLVRLISAAVDHGRQSQ